MISGAFRVFFWDKLWWKNLSFRVSFLALNGKNALFGRNKSKIETGNLNIEQHKERVDEIIKVIKELGLAHGI